ncbi:MAG TPA: ABC transporter ATP-binding protein [Fimbriiglobus sp.]
MPDDAIVIDKLVVRYRGKPAVNGLSLRVPAGSVYALLGDNGAGKSTTMKVLAGQVPPDSGKAEVLGLNCWSQTYALRHRIGFVPEKPKFYDWMTVTEVGWFAAGFHHEGFLTRYADWVDQLQLDAKKKLRELSKGGYAKVGLSLALATDPAVLVLDEPTSGLDRGTRREFLGTLVELAAEGRTILVSSHSISELERFVSHAAFLKDGKLLLASSVDNLKGRYRRVEYRHNGVAPDLAAAGEVVERRAAGRSVQAVIKDVDMAGLDVLREAPGVTDFEETALNLEELYDAVMGRHADGRRRPGPIGPLRGRENEDEAYEDEEVER